MYQTRWGKNLSSFTPILRESLPSILENDAMVIIHDDILLQLNDAQKKSLFTLHVMVITTIPTFEQAHHVLTWGAKGYGNAMMHESYILSACQAIREGNVWLPPEYINRFYAVRPIGSSVSHIKEVRQQQIQFALDVAAKTPPEIMQGNVRPFTIDYLELIRTAFDAADIKNIDRILVPQQPQQADPLQMMLSDPNIVAQLAGVPYGQQNQGGQQ